MTVPKGLKFTSHHQWVKVKPNGHIVVGITDFAQSQLRDITYIELPEPDPVHVFQANDEVGVIESNKTAAPYLAPVSGVITAVNTRLLDSPELLNQDPYGAAWIFEMKPANRRELDELMDLDEYESTLPEEDEEEEL